MDSPNSRRRPYPSAAGTAASALPARRRRFEEITHENQAGGAWSERQTAYTASRDSFADTPNPVNLPRSLLRRQIAQAHPSPSTRRQPLAGAGVGAGAVGGAGAGAEALARAPDPYNQQRVLHQRMFVAANARLAPNLIIHRGGGIAWNNGDAQLEATFRSKPFESAEFLRSLMIAATGFSLVSGLLVGFLLWSSRTKVLHLPYGIDWALVGWVLAHHVLQLFQLPLRYRIFKHISGVCELETEEEVFTGLLLLMRSLEWRITHKIGLLLYACTLAGFVALMLSARWDEASSEPILVSIVTLKVFVVRIFSSVVLFYYCLGAISTSGASQSLIDTLQHKTITERDIPAGEEHICSICLNEFEVGEVFIPLGCNTHHRFHADCIKTWLRQKKTCPLCQKSVDVDENGKVRRRRPTEDLYRAIIRAPQRLLATVFLSERRR